MHPKILEICAKVREPTISDVPESLLGNQEFIESLSERRLKWETQASILMSQGKDNKVSSVNEEVSFWVNFVQTLEDLLRQLESPAVRLTQEVLKYSKKPHEVRQKDEIVKMRNSAKQIERITSDLNLGQTLLSLKKDENNKDIKDFFVQVKKLIDDYFYPAQRLKNFV